MITRGQAVAVRRRDGVLLKIVVAPDAKVPPRLKVPLRQNTTITEQLECGKKLYAHRPGAEQGTFAVLASIMEIKEANVEKPSSAEVISFPEPIEPLTEQTFLEAILKAVLEVLEEEPDHRKVA